MEQAEWERVTGTAVQEGLGVLAQVEGKSLEDENVF